MCVIVGVRVMDAVRVYVGVLVGTSVNEGLFVEVLEGDLDWVRVAEADAESVDVVVKLVVPDLVVVYVCAMVSVSVFVAVEDREVERDVVRVMVLLRVSEGEVVGESV